MANALGLKSIMGIGKQADYDTALAAPTDKVPFYSEGLEKEIENLPDETLEGTAAHRELYENFNTVAGPIEVPLMYTVANTSYKSIDLLIAAAMGANTWDVGSGTNIITLDDDVDEFLTLGILKGSTVFEYLGTSINNMTFNFSQNEISKVSFDTFAKLERISGTSFSSAELNALLTDLSKLSIFKQMCFYIGDQSDALQDSDKLGTSSLKVTLNNTLTDPQQVSCTDGGNTLYPIQPNRNGFRNITGTFEVPRYASETVKNWEANQTRLQAKVVCTLSASYTFTILLPHIKLTNVSIPASGPSVITQTANFRALKNNSNTFMQTAAAGNITNEMVIETKNDRTGAIL